MELNLMVSKLKSNLFEKEIMDKDKMMYDSIWAKNETSRKNYINAYIIIGKFYTQNHPQPKSA